MLYRDGRPARLGDKVRIKDTTGVIVFSVDTDEYAPPFKREDWHDVLKHGVMIDFERWGLIHYIEPDEDLEFVSRSQTVTDD